MNAVVLMANDDPYYELPIHRPPWASPAAILFGFLGIVALIVAAIATTVAILGLTAAVSTFWPGKSLAPTAMIGGLMMIVHLLGFGMYPPGRHRVVLGLLLGVLSLASIGVAVAVDYAGFGFSIVIGAMLTHSAAIGGLQLTYYSERLSSREQWRSKHLRKRQCPHCLYDIRNLPEPRCPECGGLLQMPRGPEARR